MAELRPDLTSCAPQIEPTELTPFHDPHLHKMSTPDDRYVHEALTDNANQIRVLELHSARSYEDAISCELRVVDAPNEPLEDASGDYEAVSYAWGDTTLTHTIWIDRCRLGITAGLDVALRHLRYSNGSRLLWVDAVCIDQSNDEEKNHQVQMLQRMFNGAREMIIWLGPGEEDTDDAMDFLRSNCLRFIPHDRLHRHPGLAKIFARAWWTRVWTAMELLFRKDPPRLVCGWYWASWTAVETAMGFSGIADGFPDVYTKILSARSIRKWCHNSFIAEDCQQILEIMQYVSDRHASDIRDYVFAIAPLVPQTMHALGLPDYSLSISAVFQRATTGILSSHPGYIYEPIRTSCAQERQRPDIPSWCIDFSAPEDLQSIGLSYFDGLTSLTREETGGNPLRIHDLDEGLLIFTAYEFDEVFDTLFLPKDLLDDFSRDFARLHSQGWQMEQQLFRGQLMVDLLELILPFRRIVIDRLELRLGEEKVAEAFAAGCFWKFLSQSWRMEASFVSPRVRESSLLARDQEDAGTRALRSQFDIGDESYAMLERSLTRAMNLSADSHRGASASAAECLRRLSDHDVVVLGLLALSRSTATVFVTNSGFVGTSQSRVQRYDSILRFGDLVAFRPREDHTWNVAGKVYIWDMTDLGRPLYPWDAIKRKEIRLR